MTQQLAVAIVYYLSVLSVTRYRSILDTATSANVEGRKREEENITSSEGSLESGMRIAQTGTQAPQEVLPIA